MPFGFFRTPGALMRSFSGGDDVTDAVLQALQIEPQWHPTDPIPD